MSEISIGFPGLTGLYNILSHIPNNLYKRTANVSDFFGDYAPYAPKLAAEYRTDMDQVVDTAIHGPLNYTENFSMNKFKVIRVDNNFNWLFEWWCLIFMFVYVGPLRSIWFRRLC